MSDFFESYELRYEYNKRTNELEERKNKEKRKEEERYELQKENSLKKEEARREAMYQELTKLKETKAELETKICCLKEKSKDSRTCHLLSFSYFEEIYKQLHSLDFAYYYAKEEIEKNGDADKKILFLASYYFSKNQWLSSIKSFYEEKVPQEEHPFPLEFNSDIERPGASIFEKFKIHESALSRKITEGPFSNRVLKVKCIKEVEPRDQVCMLILEKQRTLFY